MIRRASASSSWARSCTSITWKGSMSAMRAARIKFASRFMGNRPRQYRIFQHRHIMPRRAESRIGCARRRAPRRGGIRLSWGHAIKKFKSEFPHGRPAAQERPGISPPATAGKDFGHPHQRPGEPARSRACLHPRGGAGLRGDRARPGRGTQHDFARKPYRRCDQRDRRAGVGSDRAARGEARDGRQGGALQEIRRDRLLRHRGERARSGEAGRDHRGPGAHVRRNQPRGHQGPGMLPRRAQAARANEDPGVSRRPARHRHHRRRRSAERAAGGGQGTGGSEARLLGRGRGGARLPRSAGQLGTESRQRLGLGHQGCGGRGPQGRNGSEQGPLSALDVGATAINEPMKLAAVRAIADLAMAEQSDVVAAAYGEQNLKFGPEYLIPKPFDPRLIAKIAPAVARAAMDSGVATRPIADFDAYRNQLLQFVYHSGLIMKPIFTAAKEGPRRRIVFAEGEDERILRAAQVVVDEGLAELILVGRPAVVERRIERYGLRIRTGADFELVNPESDPRYREYWTEYHRLTDRRGVSQQYAQIEMRRRPTLIGAMMIHRGEAEGMICGTFGTYASHLQYVDQVIGRRPGAKHFYAMNVLMLPKRTVFICDTYVHLDPTAEQLAEMTMLAAEAVRRFGVVPKAALLSHSSFGTSDAPSAQKMRQALEITLSLAPEIEIEGEMHGDAALNAELRLAGFPRSRLKEEANLLIMPTLY